MYTKIVIIWDVKLQDLKTLRFINSAKKYCYDFWKQYLANRSSEFDSTTFFFLRNKIGF